MLQKPLTCTSTAGSAAAAQCLGAALSPDRLPISPTELLLPQSCPSLKMAGHRPKASRIDHFSPPWLQPSWLASDRPICFCVVPSMPLPRHSLFPTSTQILKSDQVRPSHSSAWRPPGSSSLNMEHKSPQRAPRPSLIWPHPHNEPRLTPLSGGCPLF